MLRKSVLTLLLITVAACGAFSREAPPEDVDKAGALFFERLKGAEYDAIFSDGASDLRTNKTRTEVVGNLTKLMANGKLMVYARLSTAFTEEEKKRIAIATYSTIFENGRGEVKLYFADERGEWKLGGFEYKTKG